MYVPASRTQELASYHERDYYMFAIFTYGTHQGPLSTYWFFSFFLYFLVAVIISHWVAEEPNKFVMPGKPSAIFDAKAPPYKVQSWCFPREFFDNISISRIVVVHQNGELK